MTKRQLNPRYMVLICVLLVNSSFLAGAKEKRVQSSNSASDLAQLAIEAYEREDFGQAVKFFSEAVQQSPGSLILQVHLANALAHWGMQSPNDRDARTRADAAEATLRNVLRESPQNRLALWDLAMLYEFEGRRRDSQQTLAILLRSSPNDSDALTASGTIAAMQIYFDIQNEKRKADIQMKSPGESTTKRFASPCEANLSRESKPRPHSLIVQAK